MSSGVNGLHRVSASEGNALWHHEGEGPPGGGSPPDVRRVSWADPGRCRGASFVRQRSVCQSGPSPDRASVRQHEGRGGAWPVASTGLMLCSRPRVHARQHQNRTKRISVLPCVCASRVRPISGAKAVGRRECWSTVTLVGPPCGIVLSATAASPRDGLALFRFRRTARRVGFRDCFEESFEAADGEPFALDLLTVHADAA